MILPFLITLAHFWLFESDSHPIVLEEIYYIPLFLGILRFGLRGAFWTYGIVSSAYLPFFLGNWAGTPLALLDRFLHLLFSGIFAFLAGFLIDRERRHQKQAEKDRYLAGIGQVATTIVHDLKNPLMAILAFAKRIREGKGNPDKAAGAIWDSAQTMQKIVESTLDFARPIQLDIKEEDLAGIIKKVVHACKPKCEESGVTLSARVPAAPMKIALDGHHIERGLMNLVANSMDASSAGQEVVISNSALRGHAVEWITLIPMGR